MAVFEEDYFEGEYREGFYIESMMKRTWAAQIDVLENVAKVCDKYGLRYFADSGTLLGAVRHKGYIPWDDDIDISMFREDYEKLVAIAQKELPEGYQVYDARVTDSWSGAISRIVNGAEVGYANMERMKKCHGCPYIVGIDIFVIDSLPDEKEVEDLLMDLLVSLWFIKCEVKGKETIDEATEKRVAYIEELCGVKLERGKKLANEILNLTDTLCCIYNNKSSEEVTCLYWYMGHRYYRFKREWYRENIMMPFENIMIPVPVGYDEILKVAYGQDYMVPTNKKGGHDYPHYRSQQEQWEQYEVRMLLKAVLQVETSEIEKIEVKNISRQIGRYCCICRGKKYRVSVPRAGESEKITEELILGEADKVEEIMYMNAEKGYCVERLV